MANKQILTNVEIEKDIVHAIKHPPRTSEKSYKSGTLPAILIVIFLVVMEFVYPPFILWALLALLVALPVMAIVGRIRLKHRIKHVSIADYEITTETVHSIDEEHFKVERGGGAIRRYRSTETVNNYYIRFENGKIWHLPKELYAWNERLRRGDMGIFNATHRDDRMIVVTKKDTGEIVVAYHTDIFEYSSEA